MWCGGWTVALAAPEAAYPSPRVEQHPARSTPLRRRQMRAQARTPTHPSFIALIDASSSSWSATRRHSEGRLNSRQDGPVSAQIDGMRGERGASTHSTTVPSRWCGEADRGAAVRRRRRLRIRAANAPSVSASCASLRRAVSIACVIKCRSSTNGDSSSASGFGNSAWARLSSPSPSLASLPPSRSSKPLIPWMSPSEGPLISHRAWRW